MITSILVAVDGSEHAREAMRVACDMAAKFDAPLTVVHVMTTGGSYEVPSGIQEYAEIEQIYITEHDILEGVAETITSEACEIALDAGIGRPETVVRTGRPAETIVDVAGDIDADLIVVGNRGLTGVGRMLTGSVSNEVNHLAHCSVLTVR